jgi:hypothetical protein
VLLATAIGIGAGVLYAVEIPDAFSFMFYNALFNCYVCAMAYMYTPGEGRGGGGWRSRARQRRDVGGAAASVTARLATTAIIRPLSPPPPPVCSDVDGAA